MSKQLEAWADPEHPGNGPAYHTGRRCQEPSCDDPAGSYWCAYLCFNHNQERMQRLNTRFDAIQVVYRKETEND